MTVCLWLAAAGSVRAQEEDDLLRGPERPLEGAVTAEAAVVTTPELTARADAEPARGVPSLFLVPESGTWTLTQRSDVLTSYLVVREPDGEVLAEGGGELWFEEPALTLELDADLVYEVVACGLAGTRGTFEVEWSAGRPARAEGPALNERRLELLARRTTALEALDLAQDERARRRLALCVEEGTVAQRAGRSKQAERALIERLRLVRELHPDDPVALGDALFELADVHYYGGAYRAALTLLQEAVELEAGRPEPDDARLGVYLASTGLSNLMLADYSRAEEYLQRALEPVRNGHGEQSERFASLLDSFGGLHNEQGDRRTAKTYFQRSLAIREAIHPATEPMIAFSLNNLANACRDLGQYPDALPLYARALEIRERALGPRHPLVAVSLMDFGLMLISLGKHAEARPHLERALEIQREAHGPRSRPVAGACNNLALVLHSLRSFADAEQRYREALEITAEAYGPGHPRVLQIRSNLAALLLDMDEVDRGCEALQGVVEERSRALGPDHPQVSFSLYELGAALLQLGRVEEAREAAERAYVIRLEAYGEDHVLTWQAEGLLAHVDLREGRPGRALETLRALARATEEKLGAQSHEALHAWQDLAQLEAGEGDTEAALEILRRTFALSLDHSAAVLAAQSEAEGLRYLETYLRTLELYLQLSSSGASYDAALNWKGQVGRVLSTSRARILSRMSDERLARVEELRELRSRLSNLAFEDGQGDPSERAARADELRRACNRLERELRMDVHQEAGNAQRVGWREVSESLREGEVLVDFLVRRPVFDAEFPRLLTAWVLKPGGASPARVELGSADAVEELVGEYLSTLVAERGTRPGTQAEDRSGERLRELLLDPLGDALDGARHLLVAPDGGLATLPLGIVPVADDRYLLEDVQVTVLQDASVLIDRPDEASLELRRLLSVGGVDFGRRGELTPEAGDGTRGHHGYWARLPETKGESQLVADMHRDVFGDDPDQPSATLLQGSDATEERLKQELGRHDALHVATHGFFLPKGLPSMWEQVRDDRGRASVQLRAADERLLGSHPSLLSGLVCAGANRGYVAGRDDSYLTAEEVAWLDLREVELVVLSACETGLGRPQSGEGLMGLRRSFHLAGAPFVVSSMWSVGDESTARLMAAFYRNLWFRGQPVGAALRAAQLEVLKAQRIEEGRALPSTWGAFVLSVG